MEEKYELGIVVGRFQMLHAGHEEIIETGLRFAKRVAVLVGSAQESNTNKNPFDYAFRESVLKKVFGDRIEVYPLEDQGLGNVPEWGKYLFKFTKEKCGCFPDLIISGKESRRNVWFDFPEANVAELFVPKTIQVSGSMMREYLLQNDRENWEKYINPVLHPFYETFKRAVNLSTENKETKSM